MALVPGDEMAQKHALFRLRERAVDRPRKGKRSMSSGNINNLSDDSPRGQLLVYAAEDGRIKIDVRLENETVWLTQRHIAELFQTSKQNIGQHLRRVFSEGELIETLVVKNFFTTAADGKRYRTNFYNLDAIISVGYRVKSAVATRFRI